MTTFEATRINARIDRPRPNPVSDETAASMTFEQALRTMQDALAAAIDVIGVLSGFHLQDDEGGFISQTVVEFWEGLDDAQIALDEMGGFKR